MREIQRLRETDEKMTELVGKRGKILMKMSYGLSRVFSVVDFQQKIFNKFDNNSDSEISCGELRGMLPTSDADQCGGTGVTTAAGNKELKDTFNLCDLDKNGLIFVS
ncbi:Parvalbumin [Parasponia andersonii]|uniref:Parvalbumin n=1 Tax=Parasponia andersonii TaxID=3476 RepID=A0A2P5AY40_PARAD|nr:Parvalbumin [Parasponia andersonii]